MFVDAAACGDLDGLKRLLAGEVDVNVRDKDGRTAFHYGCLNDDVPLLETLLADERVDVGLRSARGDTGLHMAALYAALEALKLLVADGRLSLDAQNKYGETPLHLCAGSGDKGASKAAALLLESGASLVVTDQWHRGPLDVSRENAENPLVAVFEEFLKDKEDLKAAVEEVSREFRAKNTTVEVVDKAVKSVVFTQLGTVKLKKTTTAEKSMFLKQNKIISNQASTMSSAKTLSKLIDFPGDVEEIKKYLEDPEIDAEGPDAYGLTALHKFASWNKIQLIDLLLPRITDINARDADGKTALHWAVEMASVAAVTHLVRAGIDLHAKDNKGRDVLFILNSVPTTDVITRLLNALHPN
ncbi:hypothetical protein CTAYLR_007488 [Chrysophaeum taylorii]|uniref:Uncharacterized protein n=1 Tax=Chrysophaeum taylorii TaxID=2483200 RepID=A0AAD7UBI5_9STRA|nr:hypothetical protein CTAYLR_007488 [Chrysophaeum taylorii]